MDDEKQESESFQDDGLNFRLKLIMIMIIFGLNKKR